MKIYKIDAYTGDYDDYQESVIAYYTSEVERDKHYSKLMNWLKENASPIKDNKWEYSCECPYAYKAPYDYGIGFEKSVCESYSFFDEYLKGVELIN